MTQPPARILGTTNTCNNCNFFDPPDSTEGLGRCRYPAPSMVNLNQQGRAIWPLCSPTDWCGQWAAVT